MADIPVPLNPGAGPINAAAATDGSGNAWQKIVVGQELTAGNPTAVTTGSPLQVAQQGNLVVGGSVAAPGANTGNPVKIGGVYNSSPTSLSSGQIGDADRKSTRLNSS